LIIAVEKESGIEQNRNLGFGVAVFGRALRRSKLASMG
jgi:hypothetical protein